MKAHTTIPSEIHREKTRKTLIHSPKLQERIASQIRDFGGTTIYDYEKDRFEKVIRKLAYGHLAYENDTLSWDSTYNISLWLLPDMSDAHKRSFFQPYEGDILPEVCSHGLSHVALNYDNKGELSFSSYWIPVQKNQYCYCVSPNSNRVKFVIADFLAAEVRIIEN